MLSRPPLKLLARDVPPALTSTRLRLPIMFWRICRRRLSLPSIWFISSTEVSWNESALSERRGVLRAEDDLVSDDERGESDRIDEIIAEKTRVDCRESGTDCRRLLPPLKERGSPRRSRGKRLCSRHSLMSDCCIPSSSITALLRQSWPYVYPRLSTSASRMRILLLRSTFFFDSLLCTTSFSMISSASDRDVRSATASQSVSTATELRISADQRCSARRLSKRARSTGEKPPVADSPRIGDSGRCRRRAPASSRENSTSIHAVWFPPSSVSTSYASSSTTSSSSSMLLMRVCFALLRASPAAAGVCRSTLPA